MSSSRFNLEKAIATWRRFFAYRRSFLGADLEELELHLREDIAQRMQDGRSEEEAFREATAKLGSVTALDEDFEEVYWTKLRHKRGSVAVIQAQASILRSYTVSAVRNLLKYKGFSFLNVSGLVVGLAAAFLVFLWVQHELSVDAFHEQADRLYQVRINAFDGQEASTWSNAPAPLAEALESTFPEIESAMLSLPIRAAFRREDRTGREEGLFAGPALFRSFTFPFLAGDPESALNTPEGIAISRSTAAALFGPDWATAQVIGAPLTMDFWQSNGGVLGNAVRIDAESQVVVTGVFEDAPEASSLQFDFVLPVQRAVDRFPHVAGWGPRWFEVFVLLKPNADSSLLAGKLETLLTERDPSAVDHQVFLQPFANTYLHDAFRDGQASGGRIQRVYLIALVGLAVLLIACINFTNLMTARSSLRSREIGVRKAIGATPGLLVQQFLGEAVVTAAVSCVVAVGLVAAVLPLFGSVTGISFTMSEISPRTWAGFGAIAVAAGLLAGAYPALVLSTLNVLRVLRGKPGAVVTGGAGLRKTLVIVQFSISAFLVVGTLTITQQLDFLRSKDLGMDHTNVAAVTVEGEFDSDQPAIRDQLLQSPAIEQVSWASAHPLGVAIITSNVLWEGKRPDQQVLFKVLDADEQFAGTMKLRLKAGRFFDPDLDAGQLNYVVNEAAVHTLGLNSPIGYPFALGHQVAGTSPGRGKIVGVVEDFHSGSLIDERIGPLIMSYRQEDANFMLIRVADGQEAQGLSRLAEVNDRFNPNYPLEYLFLNSAAEAFYADQRVASVLSQGFAVIALIVACLGLLGLATFTVQRRTREMGIRMVLGASRRSMLVLLSRELMLLVLASVAVTLPVAYWAMDRWLDSFAYRIQVSALTLFAAAGMTLLVTALTVGAQAARAATARPTSMLRSD